MSNKVLSVIVPTYNMENYLDKCLSSLILGEPDSEIMCCLEVIVVNDGSSDRSSEIAHHYKAKYPNSVKVLDKKNGNYGSCINAALPIARGKYVKVLDADDWFDTEILRQYIRFLEEIDVDAIINDYKTVKVSGETTEVFSYSKLSADRVFFLSEMSLYFCDVTMHAVTYQTELLRSIKYHQSEGLFYTDQEWIFLPLSQAQSLRYYPHRLYMYLKGRDGQSVSRKVWEKNYWMEIQGERNMLQTYSIHKEGLGNDYLRSRLLFRLKIIFDGMIHISSSQNEKLLRQFDKELRIQYPDIYKAASNIHFATYHNLRYYYVRLWRMGVPRRILKFFLSVLFILKHRFGI